MSSSCVLSERMKRQDVNRCRVLTHLACMLNLQYLPGLRKNKRIPCSMETVEVRRQAEAEPIGSTLFFAFGCLYLLPRPAFRAF